MFKPRQLLPFILCIITVTAWGCGGSKPTHSTPQHNLPPEVKQDVTRAEEGDVTAQYQLGQRYSVGSGVPQDHAKAREWYQKAAGGGSVSAQYNLGYMYEIGQGADQNYALAGKYYRMAANQGHAKAQYNLGGMYHEGKGVKKDNVEAYMWLTLSAKNGNRKARSKMIAVGKTMSSEAKAVAQQKAARHR